MSDAVAKIVESDVIYSEEEIALLSKGPIPKHVAIIMDGNRRWAKHHAVEPIMGHWQGAEALTEIVKAAAELGVKTLTVYAFSTENWSRPQEEVEDLMDVFELYLKRKQEDMVRDGVKLYAIGNVDKLPVRVKTALLEAQIATEKCGKIELILALNYGGRDELRRAVVQLLKENIEPEMVTEEMIGAHLDTARFTDPELLIRTSGEMRVSNFLLWQISYAEIVSAEVFWPDFSPKELLKTFTIFQKRSRRLGQ